MSTHSFPLIGIDLSGNQHEFEYLGASAIDAAKKGAQMRGYIEVRSADKRLRRSGNGDGIYYGKPLFKAEPSNPIFTRPKSAFALLLEDPFLKTGPAILKHLRDKGFSVTLVDDKVKLTPGPNCKVRIEERGALRNFIGPNTQLIIDALRAEATSTAPEKVDKDPLKGKKLREIVLSILPQMPTPFTKEDFLIRLRAANFTLLAEDGAKIQYAITYCTREGGEVAGVGRGKYSVREKFKHRKTPTQPKLVTLPTAELSSEEAVAFDPVKTSESAFRVDEPEPTPQESETPVAAPTIQTTPPTVNPLVALLDLASQAAAGADDAADLAAKFTEARATFESTMLDAVSAFTAAVKPMVETLIKQNTFRQALARSLTATSPGNPGVIDGS